MAGSPSAPSRRSIFAASFIGTSIEWYDYYIFGTAAALVFGTLFFPQFSSVAGTLAAFGTFAVGFIARPLGAAVIGHYGDRIGRKAMLVLTLLLTGGATALIGLLPTYAAIGVGAPLLLVLLRLLQGFGVGGEWGGAVLIATEHASPRRRAVYGSFAQFGVPIGVLTSNLAFLAVAGLPDESFVAWGWRIPFLLSIVLVVVGFVVRSRLQDAPEFEQVKAKRETSTVPFTELLRRHPRVLGLAQPRLDRTAGHRLHRDRLHAQLRHDRAGLRAHHPAHADHALDGRVGGDDRRRGAPVRPLRLATRVHHRCRDGRDLAGPDVRAGQHRLGRARGPRLRGGRGRPGHHGRRPGRAVQRDLPGARAVQRHLDRLPGRRDGRRGHHPARRHRAVRRHRLVDADRALRHGPVAAEPRSRCSGCGRGPRGPPDQVPAR